MNRENRKPPEAGNGSGNTAPAPARGPAVTTALSGRVKHDDRGNAIWEWALSTGVFGTEPSPQKLKKLDNPSLSLAEDPPLPSDTAIRNPLGAIKGYSPYDSGVIDKTEAPRKRKDLRKLGEWIKLRAAHKTNVK